MTDRLSEALEVARQARMDAFDEASTHMIPYDIAKVNGWAAFISSIRAEGFDIVPIKAKGENQ